MLDDTRTRPIQQPSLRRSQLTTAFPASFYLYRARG